MISEITDGVILDYVPDALGSIHSVIDQDANVVKTMRYKPYGEVLSRSGTVADRHYQWVGSYGYRATFAPSSSHYVKARHYSATAGSWTTVDPLWPDEKAYGYAGGRATTMIDPSGQQVGSPGGDFTQMCRGGFDLSLLDIISLGCEDAVAPCRDASAAFGFSKGHDKTNALGHCMTACCIQRRVPLCVGYWSARELGFAFGHDASLMDDVNNNVGYRCAGGSASCYACCLKKIDELTWYEPKPHNWPPRPRTRPRPGPEPRPCRGKICPVGSHLNTSTCNCEFDIFP
jgi:RHS repeat-associated protein